MLTRKQIWRKYCSKPLKKDNKDNLIGIPKFKKSITFHNIAKVTLIPKREEYILYDLDKLIWWSEKELEDFRINYINEMKYNTI